MTAPSRWLLKSEPDVFGYPHLERVGVEPWNGVRNYQARNNLRLMRVGDLALFYHSVARYTGGVEGGGVVGVARVVRAAHPDNLQFDPTSPYHDPRSPRDNPRWSMVDVAPVAALPRALSLDDLRALPEWQGSALLQRGTRLSVLPVTDEQFRAALQAGGLDLAVVSAALGPQHGPGASR